VQVVVLMIVATATTASSRATTNNSQVDGGVVEFHCFRFHRYEYQRTVPTATKGTMITTRVRVDSQESTRRVTETAIISLPG
jgi:hypothetical protein